MEKNDNSKWFMDTKESTNKQINKNNYGKTPAKNVVKNVHAKLQPILGLIKSRFKVLLVLSSLHSNIILKTVPCFFKLDHHNLMKKLAFSYRP